ncbi:MAG: multidrug efflux RND transporter permease subunit [Thermodesulfovibrionales bacterium]|nr:multidrug efflux RND transporter permease subunit [Thermodesulfovibrionales bacterium]
MISHFSIKRPVFASVLSIVIVIAGIAAMTKLPISQYPDITPPKITVYASYPGADAETVAQSVAAPIETQINGVDNMIYMESSSSSSGDYTLTISFEIGTNPDIAQVQVQNRVNLALPFLPDAVQKTGVSVVKRSGSFLMLIAIYSPEGRYDKQYIDNYANLYILDAIKRINGANQASILGSPDQAMRIWLNPDRMASLGITPSDVHKAIASQNQQFGVGRLGQPPTNKPVEMTIPVVTQGRFSEPKDFEQIILKTDPKTSAIVDLQDIARVEIGRKDYLIRSDINGKPATYIAIYQQTGSNALDVADEIMKTMPQLKKQFPEGLDYVIALDTTTFVRESIKEVIITLFEAICLVILVVFLFLQSLRATLIPTIAVLVSITGAFAGMYLAGFSINLLTLFGLVLAIGIVVDDAIVVVENVERNMRQLKLSPKDAAFKAMEEVTSPVIAIVLVLSAVFIPVAFVSGTTGLLYKQFAITIVISVCISGFVALTLTPAMSALILKPQHKEPKGFFRWFNDAFEKITHHYTAGVKLVIKRFVIALSLFAVMIVLVLALFKKVPTSFVPQEDQGYLFGIALLPDSASIDRTDSVSKKAGKIFGSHPAVDKYTTVSGYSMLDNQIKTTAASFFITLKDFNERKSNELSAFSVIQHINLELKKIKDAITFILIPPAIPGLSSQGGFEFWIQDRGQGNMQKLQGIMREFIKKASEKKELTGLTTTLNASSRQLRVDVDRQKAETLGVPVQEIYDAMQTLFGSAYVSQYISNSRVWQVILQAEADYRLTPKDIEKIYVRQKNGHMVPLSAVTKSYFVIGSEMVPRFNTFPAAKITGQAAHGYSSGQAIQAMEEVASKVLPDGYTFTWSGLAYEEKKSGGTSIIVFAFGLIMVFLILAAQYEAWGLPMSVITAVPFGIFGALLAVALRGLENDVYFQIGLVTLIGLSAKNAILIVEFAVMKLKEGLSITEAALEAARLRLRPIIMTSLAFIFGAIPLAIATGAGANARHSIGTGIIGGMLAATTLAIFFVPLFFWIIENIKEKISGKKNTEHP